jgi:hypothetical protein
VNASGKKFPSDFQPRVCRQDLGGLATTNESSIKGTRRDLFERGLGSISLKSMVSVLIIIILVAPL